MNTIRHFFQLESASGILLMVATAIALIVANSPLSDYYNMLISTSAGAHIGDFSLSKPLLLWINDGLMAAFFFLVGLELKRELMEGQLTNPSNVVLPIVGAVGGMAVPALIYLFFTADNPNFAAGWAIPAATDIAFALGILALLGKAVPSSLKLFLVTLAIIDDIGAILIIALFYTSEIATTPLIIVAICISLLTLMNRLHISDVPAYIMVGGVLWLALLKSGVHATLAGVVLAFFIPMRDKDDPEHSPVKHLEHSLHPSVAFLILPIFALANAGLDLGNISINSLMHPVTLGIALGLFVGKQLGVFGLCYLTIKTGLAKLPKDMNLLHLYGISILCGVGFTMSLFIGSLAFEETGNNMLVDERLGILIASLLSSVVGFLVLKFALKDSEPEPTKNQFKGALKRQPPEKLLPNNN
ncbi:Na+/H+ antiporter NhaA [Paraneptunicella aestuarii]|uniref:Na+/H+ antiporter NhaA n=1 Tax=Paraneptunicella aestuarii TaxID=2831148 RepID=UPI001E5DA36E|nr:Na+/H+ antiporter NhaA [Paraneptunicella aestuarii]UAA39979.1 Na+/H+ antiporter NhaA [Paraneptunicella aestuarii]